MIAIFCGHLLEGTRPTIFGDGSQTRDYVYVGDVVDANLRAAELDRRRLDQHRHRRADERHDIVEALAALAPGDFDAEHRDPRPGEVQDIALDASLRARTQLGWEALVGLERGLELTLASLR